MEGAEKILVTGATGFIGTRLVQQLAEQGYAVRALSRREAPTAPPGFGGKPWNYPQVEVVRGDITDRASLRCAMAGCTRVFHLAAYAKNWARDRNTYFQLNVQAVRNVFDVAQEVGMRRVVWTSTFLTFGPTPPGVIGDEAMARIRSGYDTEYEATKSLAEKEALQRAAAGFPVVIVNPTRAFGPGHLTEGNAVAQLIDDYDRGRMPFLLNRGRNVGNWVFVDDLVQGHILAMERGRVGERYILGGENASLKEFFRLIDEVSGKRHFQLPLLTASPLILAWILKKRADWLGVYPRVTPGWVRTFAVDWAYRCDKAIHELGFRPTPLREAIRRTYDWLLRLRNERLSSRNSRCGSQLSPGSAMAPVPLAAANPNRAKREEYERRL